MDKIGDKLEKMKAVKIINKELDVVNKFFPYKDTTKINIKSHTMKKKWSPFEKQWLKVSG